MKLTCAAMLSTCLLLQACGGGAGAGAPSPPLRSDAVLNEVWPTAAPADAGMNGEQLAQIPGALPAAHGLASMLILRHGKAVSETYWNGYDKDAMHDMRSATKSITSLLVGIAIDKGMISSENEAIATRLDAAYRGAPALQQNITVRHLLTMSSGLDCDDRDLASKGNEEYMYPKQDWISFFASLPALRAPGTQSRYCTAGVVALGRILSEASRRPAPDFATQHLFAPVGIAAARWATFDSQKQTDTGGHLYLRPRDMAKIGQLVLQRGMWNGAQVVSAEWIARSTSMQVLLDGASSYGYLWWLRTIKVKDQSYQVHYANGNGGQYIVVVPELDLVAVFTGENYNAPGADLPFTLLQQYILPAAR